METINNIARSAANAVWGENTSDGKEPISGQQGNTAKGEPYDKGNLEEPQSNTSATGQTTKDSLPTGGDSPTTGHPESKLADRTASGADSHKENAEFAKTTGIAAESDKVPDNKQTDLKAKDAPADTTKGQNDTRDPSNPQTNPKNNPTDVDDTADGPSEGQKLDGPGPKPLEEVAKEHGGDAGNNTTTKASDSDDKKGAEAESDDPNDPRAPSHGEGTGEKYIKSTGLAADGGDFDVTKAGAGREADRILEEKGIHVDKKAPGAGEPATKTTSPGSETEKKSLKDKIKDKLHRH